MTPYEEGPHLFAINFAPTVVGAWAAGQCDRDTSSGDWKYRVWTDDDGYLWVLGRDFEALP